VQHWRFRFRLRAKSMVVVCRLFELFEIDRSLRLVGILVQELVVLLVVLLSKFEAGAPFVFDGHSTALYLQ